MDWQTVLVKPVANCQSTVWKLNVLLRPTGKIFLLVSFPLISFGDFTQLLIDRV